MSEDLGNQVYTLTVQNMVTLWIIDFNPVITFDTPQPGIMYLSSYKQSNNADMIYGGNTYNFVGVEAGGFRSETNGQMPQPNVTIDKQSLVGLPQYQAIKAAWTAQTGQVYFDWRGAKITRIRTTSNYINDPSKGDTDNFIVDQLTRTTASTIELKLAVSVGADRINNLSVQSLSSNRCSLRYRTHNGSGFDYINEDAGGCPYGNPTTQSNWGSVPDFGVGYFNESDASTTESSDACSYGLKGCQLRFDPNEEGLTLPFVGKYKNVSNDSSQEPGSI